MTDDALFPPTPVERLAVVSAFITEERKHRVHMLRKYEDDAGQVHYWGRRVTQCDEALMHLAALSEAVG